MFPTRILSIRSAAHAPRIRLLSTTETPSAARSQTSSNEPNTHYRITLLRSAIALPERFKGTLVALGIHRRMQTVYHPHSPDIAGKILKVKELVEVQNVPTSSVRTKTEQRWERRPKPGFRVVASYRSGGVIDV